MTVEFIKADVNEAQTGHFPAIKNEGKPFDLDDKIANAYIEMGVLRQTAKPKAEAKEKK